VNMCLQGDGAPPLETELRADPSAKEYNSIERDAQGSSERRSSRSSSGAPTTIPLAPAGLPFSGGRRASHVPACCPGADVAISWNLAPVSARCLATVPEVSLVLRLLQPPTCLGIIEVGQALGCLFRAAQRQSGVQRIEHDEMSGASGQSTKAEVKIPAPCD